MKSDEIFVGCLHSVQDLALNLASAAAKVMKNHANFIENQEDFRTQVPT